MSILDIAQQNYLIGAIDFTLHRLEQSHDMVGGAERAPSSLLTWPVNLGASSLRAQRAVPVEKRGVDPFLPLGRRTGKV